MSRHFEKEITSFFKLIFDFDGPINESIDKLIALYAEFGIPMRFDEPFDESKFNKLEN